MSYRITFYRYLGGKWPILAFGFLVACLFQVGPIIAHAAPLDGISGAANGYSLRQLKSTYTNPLIRIRRTDSGEADVYSDADGYISSSSPVTIISGGSGATTLAGFVSGNDAFVETWYDQVGSNNFVQSTQSAQPQIASSSALLVSGANNRVTVKYNGTTAWLTSSNTTTLPQPFTLFLVTTAGTQVGSTARMFQLGDTNRALYQFTTGGMFAGSFLSGSVLAAPYSVQSSTLVFNTTSSQIFTNGVSIASGSAGTNTISGSLSVGSGAGFNFFTGTISEFIIFNGTLSTADRQVIENSEINDYTGTLQYPSLTITAPARGVSASSSVATISYTDQASNIVFVPYIQTSPTLSVSASANSNLIPARGGVKFTINQGLSGEQSVFDMSSPYTGSFSGLAKGTYTLDANVVDSSQAVVSGTKNHDTAIDIGIGDIYIAIGDSITKGSNGVSGTDCVLSGSITDWTQSLVSSLDHRNYCQYEIAGSPDYLKSWMPDLNNELESYNNYPIFILNEGYAGFSASDYVTNPMEVGSWKTRVSGLQPNKVLVLLGANDLSSTSTYISNITSIVNKFETTYGVSASSITLGLPLYASTRPTVQTYVAPLQALVVSAGLKVGPNFNTYFFNHPELYSDTPPIHPNTAGYKQMSRLWALSMISPQNLALSQSGSNVHVSWQSLSSLDAIPTGSANITGYKVFYGTTSGSYTTTLDVGSATSVNVSGLASAAQKYFFTVQAYDADGDVSNLATESSLTTSVSVPAATPVVLPTEGSRHRAFPSAILPPSQTVSSGGVLTSQLGRNVGAGDSGPDVLALQKYLNSEGFVISKTGAGSPGMETSYFGLLTKQALMRFQAAHAKDILVPTGLIAPTGILGPSTRAWIRAHQDI